MNELEHQKIRDDIAAATSIGDSEPLYARVDEQTAVLDASTQALEREMLAHALAAQRALRKFHDQNHITSML